VLYLLIQVYQAVGERIFLLQFFDELRAIDYLPDILRFVDGKAQTIQKLLG